jgi:prolipoprotein diacylglyceryltransferase
MQNILNPWPILVVIASPLGNFAITAHALFFTLGAIVALVYLVATTRGLIDWLRCLEIVTYGFVLGLFGARFMYLLIYPDQWTRISDLFALWRTGLVSFGGILVGGGVVVYMTRTLPGTLRAQVRSQAAMATLLAWGIGRLGNYYGLESAGIESQAWAITYGKVPVALFEAIGCLVIFCMISVLQRKQKIAHLQVPWMVGLGYALIRFSVDFWRAETVFAGLRISQWLVIGAVGMGLLLYRSVIPRTTNVAPIK